MLVQQVQSETLWLGREPADEYAPGAPAPTSPRAPDRWLRAVTAAGSLLVGFLLASGAAAGHRVAVEQDARQARLVALVSDRQEYAKQLEERLADLRALVDASQSPTTEGLPLLDASLGNAEAAAGLVAVAGRGLRLTLADAGERCTSGRQELCRVIDADLQLAVNALFAAGAEAVAVNGERLMATTAIRSAGGAILVNHRVLTSPCVIEAVGDPEALAHGVAQSPFGMDLALYRDEYGLGFRLERMASLELPAFSGSVRLRLATPTGGPR